MASTSRMRDLLNSFDFPPDDFFHSGVMPAFDWLKKVLKKRTVVCVSASRHHVWLSPFGRKCMREDERHVKVPGF